MPLCFFFHYKFSLLHFFFSLSTVTGQNGRFKQAQRFEKYAFWRSFFSCAFCGILRKIGRFAFGDTRRSCANAHTKRWMR
uniref:Putative secreted protein n=1 Tax=Anopheles triannulatus TaxID=58253 RepID=A0A2M4B263_9DIPT